MRQCLRFALAPLGCAGLLMALGGAVPLARALNPEIPAGSYFIHGWYGEDGLPSSRVRSVRQTKDGYLWMATSQGVTRFNGYRFQTWSMANEPGLRSSNFYHLEEDADGSLWLASAVGLYHFSEGRFTRYGTEEGLPSSYIRTVYRLRDGTLLIGMDRGVAVMRGGKVQDAGGWKIATGAVRAFYQRADGSVLAAGRDGVWRMTGDKVEKISGSGPLPEGVYTAFAEEPDGTLWVGSNRDVRRISAQGNVTVIGPQQGLTSRSVESLYVDRDQSVWVGTVGGLFRVREGRAERAPYPAQFAASLIGEMCETTEGALWVCSNAGVFQLRDTPARGVSYGNGLAQSVVVTMIDTSDGAWWIGLWSGGVYRYENGVATPVPALAATQTGVTYTMLEDPDGTLWIGGDSGLHCRRGGTWTNLFLGKAAAEWVKKLQKQPDLELPGLAHNRVNSIVGDGEGGHWVATLGALYHLTADGKVRVVPGTLGPNFRAVYRTRSGDVWASAQAFGALRYHGGVWKLWTPADGIPSISPREFYEDSTGAVWIFSVAGMARFVNEQWRHYKPEHGFTEQINGVVEDDFGYLWFTTSKGVMRVARSDMDDIDAGKLAKVRGQVLDRGDGMPDSECLETGSPNAWKTRDGLLLFPTNSGVAVIDPRMVKVNMVKPPVHIEAIAVGGITRPMGSGLTFAPGSRDIEIQFSASSFLEPQRVKFKVRLLPLDTEWVDIGGRHDIRYPRLPPGEYDFRVMAANNHGIWNEEGAKIHFAVQPFFYQTGWFLGLSLFSAVGLIVGGVRWRVRRLQAEAIRLQKQNEELERRVAERTAALAQRSAELAEASRLAGMAEVATGVLHNVGNVLNSVNTSASLVAGGVSSLRTASLVKVSKLLIENGERLDQFFATDPRAQKLPAYLAQVAEHLEDERSSILQEVQNLVASVDHIKQIVVAQQSIAHVSGVTEVLPPAQLVDLAIGMAETSFSRHHVTLQREFAPVPDVKVERPKVLQILVNLLRNAKESMVEAKTAERVLKIKISEVPGGLVEISISDTGLGIAPENLARVFAFGFTTKKGGHGFGLHSSALAARELGGSLEARSEGLGRGATFVLRLPIGAPVAK